MSWLAGVRQEASAKGVSPEILKAALSITAPIQEVIDQDRRQPEFVNTFWNYLDRRVTPQRIARGRDLLWAHRKLLSRLYRRYGVPPVLLVAIWGLETNFGQYRGNFPVPAALATLAYDERRGGFFRAELLDALDILQAGDITPQAMLGSWAGAMGQIQFMPSTFERYAVDADGDGRKDIWQSLPDAFASAANFLHGLGWHDGERWGREVRLPKHFDWQLARMGEKKTIRQWAALGVRLADGKPLPRSRLKGAILLPQGYRGPAFLVYRNFEVLLGWNRSVNYALAVGHLSDRLAWQPPLRHGRDADNRRLTRDQAVELQQILSQLGYAPGEADGILGASTRAAIRDYQRAKGLPTDGYPSVTLFEQLKTAAAKLESNPSSNRSATGEGDPDTAQKTRSEKLPAVSNGRPQVLTSAASPLIR